MAEGCTLLEDCSHLWFKLVLPLNWFRYLITMIYLYLNYETIWTINNCSLNMKQVGTTLSPKIKPHLGLSWTLRISHPLPSLALSLSLFLSLFFHTRSSTDHYLQLPNTQVNWVYLILLWHYLFYFYDH